jgi:hypothetical protein
LTEGHTSVNEAAIAWSPDGRLIAACYLSLTTDEHVTVVIDASVGSATAVYEYRILRGSPNATWVDNTHVVLMSLWPDDDEPGDPYYLADVHTGQTRRLASGPRHEHRIAFFDGRSVVWSSEGRVLLTDPDGNDPQVLVTLTPPGGRYGHIDIIPSLLFR